MIAASNDIILVTGGAGFIGTHVVEGLLGRGFNNIRVFVRPTTDCTNLNDVVQRHRCNVDIFRGSLLSKDDCVAATIGASIVYHLAAARGVKAPSEAFLNTVVTTRNLLEAIHQQNSVRRFVTVSSFAVYSNADHSASNVLDETSTVDKEAHRRGDAYSFAKIKQEQIVRDCASRFGIPYVIVRPGVVYGPGNEAITGRVGIGTFGLFLHLGGTNRIPFTYVENCADAIVLAGLEEGVDGEAFNVLDDESITSREFLRLYKRNVRRFTSLYLPGVVSYLLCYLWEKYSSWSQGQLPPAFNRALWHAYWKRTRYTNEKLKTRLGWRPRIAARAALDLYFESCRKRQKVA